MERKTGEHTTSRGHEGYMVIGTEQLHAVPVEMTPKVEYSLPRRVVDQVRQRLPRRNGK
jgi:hypothetical protein